MLQTLTVSNYRSLGKNVRIDFGKLTVFVSLAETARQEAYDHLVQHATEAGANAIIGMRYDANEIMEGITEVLAYGTAVVVDS